MASRPKRRKPSSRKAVKLRLVTGKGTSGSAPLRTISASEFAQRFAHGVRDKQQSFTWFLGAGCSFTSGIQTAGGLAARWLRELHKFQRPSAKAEDFADWVKDKYPDYDPRNPAGFYAEAFEARHPSPAEQQREIETICAGTQPKFGYATLAELASHERYGRYCNTILTTNFDDLIADALYLYGDLRSRPLVVTHEALARYVRTNSPRPTIVKLHGDAHLVPKNLRSETRALDNLVSKQLYPFLQDHALIFVGYGGNDVSIRKLLGDCPLPPLESPIYWVSKYEPSKLFIDLLGQRCALRVDHTDFDQLMHLIRGALEIDLLEKRRWERIGNEYLHDFTRLTKEIEESIETSEDTNALRSATEIAQRSLTDDWGYFSAADINEKSNPSLASKTYLDGLSQFPDSAMLHGMFGLFLHDVYKDMDRAETHYKRAIELNPTEAIYLGNYARFLQYVRKSMNAAEAYYKRALEADPDHANNLGNYALFLQEVRKDMDAAEAHHKRAVDADPNDADWLGNYALFLQDVRKDMEAAEAHYKRALEADPNNASHLGNYALFLQNVRKDMDGAEALYKRALEADPNQANNLGNYALFLQNVRKDMDAAEAHYKRVLEADPNDPDWLGNYARFLESGRKDMDAAEIQYKRALDADPGHANNLGGYAHFLQDSRKDIDGAEVHYKRALDVDPDHANNLGNYAQLVLGKGQSEEGLALLDRADKAAPSGDDALRVELAIYRFAHDAKSRDRVLAGLKKALIARTRSPGWSFAITLDRAMQDGHPSLRLLEDLTKVASDEAPIEILDQHAAWRDA